jgi:hypothetical protein
MYAKIYKKERSYQVYHLNKHTGEKTYKTLINLKDAILLANKIDVEYHLEFKNELPKGITLDKSKKRFRLHIWISATKQKHIISSNNLQKVIECRNYMLLKTYGTT